MVKNGGMRTKNHPPPVPWEISRAFFGNGGGCFHLCESHEKTLATLRAIPTLLGMVTTYSFKNKTVDCYVFENNGWCDSYLIEAYFSDNTRLTDEECQQFFAEFREEILEAELVP